MQKLLVNFFFISLLFVLVNIFFFQTGRKFLDYVTEYDDLGNTMTYNKSTQNNESTPENFFYTPALLDNVSSVQIFEHVETPSNLCHVPFSKIYHEESCSINEEEYVWGPLIKRNMHKIDNLSSNMKSSNYIFQEEIFKRQECSHGCVDVNMDFHSNAYADIITCIELVKLIPVTRYCSHVIFHSYWGNLPVVSHVVWYILSYLVTQDLDYTSLWLWSANDVELENTPELAQFVNFPNIQFKKFNIEMVPSYIPRHFISSARTVVFTDLFRILVLQIYGGVYVDMDFLFTRSFGAILGSEWFYQWGSHCTFMNGAVMRLFKNSEIGMKLLKTLSTLEPNSGGWTVWGRDLYAVVNQILPIKKYPTCFFNPNWLTGHNYLGENPENYIWNGPYGVHLHGGIFNEIKHVDEKSDYRLVQKEICSKFNTIFLAFNIDYDKKTLCK